LGGSTAAARTWHVKAMAPGKDADGAVCAEAANDDANTKAGNPAQGNLLAKAMRQSARRLAAG
jgi:hypothetical protein